LRIDYNSLSDGIHTFGFSGGEVNYYSPGGQDRALAFGILYNDHYESWQYTSYGSEATTVIAYTFAGKNGGVLPSRTQVNYWVNNYVKIKKAYYSQLPVVFASAGAPVAWMVGQQAQVVLSVAQQRVAAALMVIENYRANGTKYSQVSRQFGCDVKYADCSSTLITILKQAGQESIFKGTYTAAMRDEIAAKSNNNSFRFHDPLAGDIMMWGGHVALVTAVLDGKVYFATMGRSGAAIGSVKLDSSCSLLTESKWGAGGFIGFWTPD
jgi:type II secretory pathway pseudopilin PulG